MRLKCIACEVLARPLYYCAARSRQIVDIDLVAKGLHESPAELRSQLQTLIDDVESDGYDAVVLAYGLCGKATAGLVASEIPLVMPRAHDCITLFLGSRDRYEDQFENNPGTFWYAQDYIERHDGSGSEWAMGAAGENLKEKYQEFVAKYGGDNADYLMEVMGAWREHYDRAVFIDMGVGDASQIEERAREEATRRGWSFERITGDLVLLRRLLEGEWEEDFLVLEPGQKVDMAYDSSVICVLSE